MKKLYSLILMALVAVSANAQIALTYKGETVDPSQTLNVYAEEENYGDETDPFIVVECGIKEPLVVNTSSSTLSVTAKVTTSDWKVMQWCFGGSCKKMQESTMTVSNVNIAAGASTALWLEPSFEEGGFATYTAKVEFTVSGKTTVYNINFVYDESCTLGIKNTSISTANSTIFDLTGRAIKNPMNGQIYIQNGRKFIQK